MCMYTDKKTYRLKICLWVGVYVFARVFMRIYVCVCIYNSHMYVCVCVCVRDFVCKYTCVCLSMHTYHTNYWKGTHEQHHWESWEQQRACLPAVRRADDALCLLLRRRRANCRCMLQQWPKRGQRWWQRCCKRTLTLQASLIRFVVEVIWESHCNHAICVACSCVLHSCIGVFMLCMCTHISIMYMCCIYIYLSISIYIYMNR